MGGFGTSTVDRPDPLLCSYPTLVKDRPAYWLLLLLDSLHLVTTTLTTTSVSKHATPFICRAAGSRAAAASWIPSSSGGLSAAGTAAGTGGGALLLGFRYGLRLLVRWIGGCFTRTTTGRRLAARGRGRPGDEYAR